MTKPFHTGASSAPIPPYKPPAPGAEAGVWTPPTVQQVMAETTPIQPGTPGAIPSNLLPKTPLPVDTNAAVGAAAQIVSSPHGFQGCNSKALWSCFQIYKKQRSLQDIYLHHNSNFIFENKVKLRFKSKPFSFFNIGNSFYILLQQINLPKNLTPTSSPFREQEGPACPVTTTSIMSTIPAPAFSVQSPLSNQSQSQPQQSRQSATATASSFGDMFKPKAG